MAQHKIIQAFHNISIKNKLRAIILLTSGIVLLLASAAFVTNEILSFRRSMVTDLLTLADLVGVSSSGGLLFDDKKTTEENIAALRVKPNIILVYIFSQDGQLFATYFRSKEEPPALPKHINALYPLEGKIEDNYFFQDNHIGVFKQIIFEQESIGTVYIQSDLEGLWERLNFVGKLVIVVMLFSLLLAFLLASKLQSIITSPIDHLLMTMKAVSADKNYGLRAKKSGNDELGSLIKGFNDMLHRIERRDKELGQYRDHLEEKVLQRTAQLSEARDEALAANKAKSIFLANMSHEIRTPMNAVLGYAQILRRDTMLTQEQRSSLKIIENSGNHLLGLINDILDISKIEAGAMEVRAENFYLDDLVHSISAMFKIRCDQKQLGWRVEDAINEHLLVYADQGKLRQILINLLGNAVKFTEEGEIVLRVARLINDHYSFEVIDTGPGISLEAQQNIFEPFQQEKSGFDKGGTGLGLAITKRQTELMDGSLDLASEPNKCTCFTVILPLPPGEGQAAIHTEDSQQISHIKPGCYVNALVVDDVRENRDILSHMLEDVGAETQEAINGQNALERIQEQVPNIVFMDIRMPVMDGMEAMRRIRQMFLESQQAHPKNKPICVAISASTLQHQSEEILAAGFDDFISKPFRFEEVYQCLTKFLKVEFEYKTIKESPADEATSTTLDLDQFCLPKDLYDRLYTAADLQEITEIEDIANQLLSSSDDKQQRFGNILEAFLVNYNIEGILDLLKNVKIETEVVDNEKKEELAPEIKEETITEK